MTPEQLEDICARLAGGESVREACEAAGIHHSSFYNALNKGGDASTRIAHARAAQQDYEADQCVTMADAATVEDHQVVKLRIWARQWRAAKLAPKKYGERAEIEHSGSIDLSGAAAAARVKLAGAMGITTEDSDN